MCAPKLTTHCHAYTVDASVFLIGPVHFGTPFPRTASTQLPTPNTRHNPSRDKEQTRSYALSPVVCLLEGAEHGARLFQGSFLIYPARLLKNVAARRVREKVGGNMLSYGAKGFLGR